MAAAREALAAARDGVHGTVGAALEARVAEAVALAADFRARAAALSGPSLREFLRLFVVWGRVDKAGRTVTLGIRHLPATQLRPRRRAAAPPGFGRRRQVSSAPARRTGLGCDLRLHGGPTQRPSAPPAGVEAALDAVTAVTMRTLQVGRPTAARVDSRR